MRITYDREVDAAYIYLEDPIPAGAAVMTHVCDAAAAAGSIHLDFDGDGKLLGIEILDASRALPATALASAERLYSPAGSRK